MSDHPGVPLWEPPATRGRGRLPDRASTVIVGGGLTGVALLRELPDAVLVEASSLAAGASGRNAGFLLAGVAANYAAASAQYGRSLTAEIWAFTSENRERMAEALGGAAELRRRGSWTVAASAQEADHLRASEQYLHEDGFEGEWLQHPAGLEPFHGALLNPRDAELNPSLAVGELARPCADRIIERARVSGLEAGTGRTRVALESGEQVVAESVVLATNGLLAELLPALPVSPMRAQMAATVPTNVPLAFRPAYGDHGYQYWRQRGDGRVLVGGYRNLALESEQTSVDTPTGEVQAHLDAHLRLIGAGGLQVTHRWAGIMGFTPDGLPLVGAVPGMSGVFVCGGYTGHGFGFALECARRLAAQITGGASAPSWLDPGRFSAVPAA